MRPSIIIVDDESQVIESLKRVLAVDFEVFGFTDARRALKFFKLHPTHIVMSDMKMPDMSGQEFLQQIREENKATRCCVVTGYADVEAAQQVINKVTVAAYFNKPWSNKDIKSKLLEIAGEIKLDQFRLEQLKSLSLVKEAMQLEQQAVLSVVDKMLVEQVAAQEQLLKSHETIKQFIGLLPLMVAEQQGDNSGHEIRISHQAKLLAQVSGLSKNVQNQLYLASLSYRIGMSQQENLTEKDSVGELLPEEYLSHIRQASLSSYLLRSVEMCVEAADILHHLSSLPKTEGSEQGEYNLELVQASNILHLVILFDYLVLGKVTGSTMSAQSAFAWLNSHGQALVDKTLVLHFQTMYEQETTYFFERAKTCNQLQKGEKLARDLVKSSDHKLLTLGTVLTEPVIEQLKVVQDNIEQTLIGYVVRANQNQEVKE